MTSRDRFRGWIDARWGMRLRLLGIATLCSAFLVLAGAAQTARTVEYPNSHLRALEVDEGPRPLVLLHGYASSPQQWLPFVATIRTAAGHAPDLSRGPRRTAGRPWPRLVAARSRVAPRQHRVCPIFRGRRPAGLAAAAARVQTLLEEITTRVDGRRRVTCCSAASPRAAWSARRSPSARTRRSRR